ncbi:MAG: hypothetical protein AB4372_00410 [Xenococcus sp. (in: cyanobacteria)]
MDNQSFFNNQKTSKQVLRMQPRVSKGNNFIELGLQHGLSGKTP